LGTGQSVQLEVEVGPRNVGAVVFLLPIPIGEALLAAVFGVGTWQVGVAVATDVACLAPRVRASGRSITTPGSYGRITTRTFIEAVERSIHVWGEVATSATDTVVETKRVSDH